MSHEAAEKQTIRSTTRVATSIWKEQPTEENPFKADSCLCHGYDMDQLYRQIDPVSMIFLLFRRQLPTGPERQLLAALMVGLANPGPRHPATRAAMAAGAGRTLPVHVLPVGLLVLGAEASQVQECMAFISKHRRQRPAEVSSGPGFAATAEGQESYICRLASYLAEQLPGSSLSWAAEHAEAHGGSWDRPSLAAAVLLELGFARRDAAAVYQLLSAPGIAAHGLEMVNKPLEAWPFPDDEHYLIEDVPPEELRHQPGSAPAGRRKASVGADQAESGHQSGL